MELFCKEYAAERNRLASRADLERSALEKELSEVTRNHGKLVDAIIAGIPPEQVKDKMEALSHRRKELEAILALIDKPSPLRVHPGMAKAYRDRVVALIRGLGDAADMETAKEAIRALIEKIVLTPDDDGGPGLSIILHGALGSLLRLACGLPITGEDTAGSKMQKDPRVAGRTVAALADLEGLGTDRKTVLVAGRDTRNTSLCLRRTVVWP